MAGQPPKRVLITRSQPGATAQGQALAAAGYQPLILPCIHIQPLPPPPRPALLAAADLYLVCTSAHAVVLGLPVLQRWCGQLPGHWRWFAVGAATATALAQQGIQAQVPAEETSEGLLALPDLAPAAVTGRSLLLLTGAGGRGLLAPALATRGAAVVRLDLYQRQALPAAQLVQQLRALGAPDVALISSAEVGAAFAAAWQALDGDLRLPLIVPTPRVAAAMQALGFVRVHCAADASVAAAIASLAALP